ncbi:mitochondrial carrier domain-containing protein [Gorgonomyces haynaldii]|nr:mitochondrial carrier domain-containing protein [Gorgonomyces haynaldii]
MSQERSPIKSFLSGACGGLTMVLASHPFDLVKVRMQTFTSAEYQSMLGATRHILKNDGFRGLYRGVTPVLMGSPLILAVNFWGYHQGQHIVTKKKELSLFELGLAGSLSAIPVAFLIGPAEQIKVRLQIQQQSTTLGATIRQIFQQVGPFGLFRGTGMTLMRDVPSGFFYFATYEGIKRQTKSETGNSFWSILLAGGTAGCVNWLIAIPFDTLKSRIQASSSARFSTAFKELMQEGGISALYRGLGPTLLRAFPASAALFAGVEGSTILLNKIL